jgi:hypothetical protein
MSDWNREEINTGPRLLSRLRQIERGDCGSDVDHRNADLALLEFVKSKTSLGDEIEEAFEAIGKVYA